MKPSRGTPDFLLLFLTLGMVGFGIVMIFSASFTISYWNMGSRWFFTQRQLIWAGLGMFLMLFTMNIPFKYYKKHFLLILVVSFILLLSVFIPGLGIKLNGSRSWIGLGSFTIQPAEFAKLGLIIYLAALISKKQEKMKDFKKGLMPCIIVTLIFFILIALQPDYGTALILATTAGIMIVVGGARLKHIFYIILIGIAVIPFIIFSADYRISRFTSYLEPWSDPYGSGYQLIQSLIALGNGGILGTGFGKGIQKFFYLPYPQSDFIFSVIGEELGFIGVTIFILIYLSLLWRVLIISLRSNNSFGTLIGVGFVSLFAVQAFINIGGVTGTIPITGVTLPFVSAGGSSLIVSMTAIGIILSLSRENNKSTQ
ncbi:cell division protein FtsW [Vulcanibacillus modesticaldus]|uniref:Cell division protein FtsW n=1 Tax=Vulcanibacillus modesticaldus TaxID=337097 RepID=A0A1D2YT79_9BACI|nr:putative lipid II flippase FtsW [Vulcanibacillus modesticaldus]OEF98902.1 cell division protein FtsW [Vulcanibacillus modesticaldus]